MTRLQNVYDRFLSKIDEDTTGKESLIFEILNSAISKSYKTVVHSLKYTLEKPNGSNQFDGYFIDNLNEDEIELLALWMLYEWDRREQQNLLKIRQDIGTSDFNRLPDKVAKLRAVNETLKTTKEDITDLKNEFNTYSY